MGLVEVEVAEHVATLTLNRPERLNALSQELYDDLNAAVRQIDSDDEIFVAVVTGAGRAFCSGGDLRATSERIRIAMTEGARRDRYLHESARMVENLLALRKPLIAAVNGPAMGAGCSLAVVADLRIASEAATFGMPFVQRGLMPDWGSTYLVPRLIGIGTAAYLAFTGEPVTAAEALRIGLVNEVVPAGELMARCWELAQRIGSNAPLAVQAAKAAMRVRDAQETAGALMVEAAAQARLQGTEDFREGVAAFLEKRPARFVGR